MAAPPSPARSKRRWGLLRGGRPRRLVFQRGVPGRWASVGVPGCQWLVAVGVLSWSGRVWRRLGSMTFGVLALIVLAGLAGPLLSSRRGALVPVVVGELAAGVVIGNSGFGWIDPNEPTTAFLAEVGFAMLMFVAGMHVPLRQPGLRSGVRRGGLAAVIAALLAVPGGIAVAAASGTNHAAI